MPAIKPLAQVGSKWARVTPQRTEDYAAGVRAPRRDWEQATAAAEDNYNTGVNEAISRGAFGRGVAAASTEKWQRKTISKGVNRWGPGVRDGEDDYEQGFAPFHQTIESTSLPERGPAGDPKNYERVRVLGEALHARKVGA